LTEINFLTDFATASKMADDKKKPLVVEFYIVECPWCRLLEDSTFTSRIVIDMSEDMFFARINAEYDSTLADRLGVAYYPTVIVFGPNGSEIDRLVGYYPPAEFFNEVELFLQGNETLIDYLTRLEDEPDRVEYNLIAARKYRNRSDWINAIKYYSIAESLASANPIEPWQSEVAAFEMAEAYAQNGDYPQAVTALESFLDRFPASENIEDVRRRIPYYHASYGDYKKSMQLYLSYLRDYPDGKYVDWVAQRIEEIRETTKEGN